MAMKFELDGREHTLEVRKVAGAPGSGMRVIGYDYVIDGEVVCQSRWDGRRLRQVALERWAPMFWPDEVIRDAR